METTNNMEQRMIDYLQHKLNDFQSDLKEFGKGDRIVLAKFEEMIACKEMVEALIGEPVNLQADGKVTIGF